MAIEIVDYVKMTIADFPIKNGDWPYSYVNVYQRVYVLICLYHQVSSCIILYPLSIAFSRLLWTKHGFGVKR